MRDDKRRLSRRSTASVLVTSDKHKVLDFLKLIVVSSPTLIISVVLISINLTKVLRDVAQGTELQETMRAADYYSKVIASLQVERGMTCVTLNSMADAEKYEGVRKTLDSKRRITDEWIEELSEAELWYSSSQYRTVHDFKVAVIEFRNIKDYQMEQSIRSKDYSQSLDLCLVNLESYTRKIDLLVGIFIRAFGRSKAGTYWIYQMADSSLTIALDVAERRQLIFLTYVTAGKWEKAPWLALKSLGGTQKKYLKNVWDIVPELKPIYEDEYGRLTAELDDLSNYVLGTSNSSYEPTDSEFADPLYQRPDPRPKLAMLWQQTTERYVALIKKVREKVEKRMEEILRKRIDDVDTEFKLGLLVTAVIGVLAPTLAIWYCMNSQESMTSIQKFMQKASEKAKQVEEEKKKGEFLLHQLLPVTVAASLKAGIIVQPEYFQCITLYFSDVVGFENIAATSTPEQMIALLNVLYGCWDSILDKYDVYKVETVGDQYLVASGLPKRNGHKHSKGKITTGVAGTKMPRYCLFGDTINTTSRLMTSGAGMRIQISDECANHLHTYHPDQFITEERGVIKIKGKGEKLAHWVIERIGFGYTVDLERAEKMVQGSMYWRSKDDMTCKRFFTKK